MPFITIALLIAAALGGGASVAAQNSLPGDSLWNFKVQVNERIAETVAVGNKAKADWDISAAQERLDEAAGLSAKGKLDAGAQAKIQGNFDAHAKAIAERVAALQSEGDYVAAADVAARFQAMLAKEARGVLDIRASLDSASTLSAEASAKVKQ